MIDENLSTSEWWDSSIYHFWNVTFNAYLRNILLNHRRPGVCVKSKIIKSRGTRYNCNVHVVIKRLAYVTDEYEICNARTFPYLFAQSSSTNRDKLQPRCCRSFDLLSWIMNGCPSAMRLIVPYARTQKIHVRSHASRERKRSSDHRHSFRASWIISCSTIFATPRISPRYSAASSRAVQRNDFNEAASITSVNRARALTGDLRPVGRAYTSI